MKIADPFPRQDVPNNRFHDELLDAKREIQEPLADEAFPHLIRFKSHGSFYDALQVGADKKIPQCVALWDHLHDVPSWVDPQRMLPGVDKALNHVVAGGLALLCGSLVESYAGAKGAKVLIRTGRLRDDTERRIYETARFVTSIASDRGALPDTPGHRYIAEVRIIHAAVRAAFRDRTDWDPEWGQPINQEDYAGTLLLFSLVFRRALSVLGVEMSHEERDSNHHIYRWVGHAMGVDEELLPRSLVEEEQLYAAISNRQYTPDDDSRILAAALLDTMAMKPPFIMPKPALYALSRAIIGDEIADQLCFPDGESFEPFLKTIETAYRAKQYFLRGPVKRVGRTLGAGFAESVLLSGLRGDYFNVFRK